MGDEVHQLTGWRALKKKKKKKGSHREGAPVRAAGVQRGLPRAGIANSAILRGVGRAAGLGMRLQGQPGVLLGAVPFSRLQLYEVEPLWRAPSEPRAPWKLASQPPLPTCNLGPTSETRQPPPSLPNGPPLAARPGLWSLGTPKSWRGGQRGARQEPRVLGQPQGAGTLARRERWREARTAAAGGPAARATGRSGDCCRVPF